MPGETKKKLRYYGNVRVALRRMNKLAERIAGYVERYGTTADQHQKRLAMKPDFVTQVQLAAASALTMLHDQWPLDNAAAFALASAQGDEK